MAFVKSLFSLLLKFSHGNQRAKFPSSKRYSRVAARDLRGNDLVRFDERRGISFGQKIPWTQKAARNTAERRFWVKTPSCYPGEEAAEDAEAF